MGSRQLGYQSLDVSRLEVTPVVETWVVNDADDDDDNNNNNNNNNNKTRVKNFIKNAII